MRSFDRDLVVLSRDKLRSRGFGVLSRPSGVLTLLSILLALSLRPLGDIPLPRDLSRVLGDLSLSLEPFLDRSRDLDL